MPCSSASSLISELGLAPRLWTLALARWRQRRCVLAPRLWTLALARRRCLLLRVLMHLLLRLLRLCLSVSLCCTSRMNQVPKLKNAVASD